MLFDVRPGRVDRSVRDPEEYGLARCAPAALVGGDAAENAARLKAALAGEDDPAHRDALALGAALALEVTGSVGDAHEGVARARAAIADGSAARLVECLAQVGQ